MKKILQRIVVLFDTLFQLMKKYLPLTRGEKRIVDGRINGLEEDIEQQEEKEHAD